ARLFLPENVEAQDWHSGNGNTLVDSAAGGFARGGYFYSDYEDKFTPTEPDLDNDYRLTMERTPPGTKSDGAVYSLVAHLGLDVGNGDLEDFLDNNPLQSLSGFAHG